jgi:hypothetical protein
LTAHLLCGATNCLQIVLGGLAVVADSWEERLFMTDRGLSTCSLISTVYHCQAQANTQHPEAFFD